MTEFEKAMILMQMAQAEYLHVIAAKADPNRTRTTAESIADALARQCPSVTEFLRNAR